MNNPHSQDHQLKTLILLEEFRYWDASRNNVGQNRLDDLNANIEKLRSKMAVSHAHVFVPLS